MPGRSRSDTRTNWQAEAGVRPAVPGEGPTGWAGLLVFAGVMMALGGLLHALAGLTALFDDGYLAVGSESLIVSVDYDVWGWAHVLVGVGAIVAAALLLRGIMAGRVMGVVIAAVSASLHFAFLPAYPWWSVLAIGFDVLVIYALSMHGAELKSGS